MRVLLRRSAAPAHEVFKPVVPAKKWLCLFIFAPDGQLTDDQHFTLAKLAAYDRKLLVICATPAAKDVPAEIADVADAVIWKALSGYDFSAFTIGLHEIARRSPGADVFVMNDSVLGPFSDPLAMLEDAPWDLTGLTATTNVENHIQSYAFQLRDVTPHRMAALSAIFDPHTAYDRMMDVVMQQETRLSRVAAKSMSVGALWHADPKDGPDPTLGLAIPMLDAGFPFIKRSLLGKLSHMYPRADVIAALERAGYPVTDSGRAR